MRMGNISKRPASILKHKSSLEGTENAAKFPIGPTISRPGPTLFRQAATEVNEVIKSNPSKAAINKTDIIKIIK